MGAQLQSSLPVVVLGFLLGMLHATDADHVVAVSTIVGRQRSVGTAARVGLLWGAGHTLTVFLVGSAIILLNLTVPPRVEQAMEFAVALMLIGLGVVNLSQVGRHVRGSLTRALAQGMAEHAHSRPVDDPHRHVHAHGDYVHAHRHGHGEHAHGHAETPVGRLDRWLGGLSAYQALRPVAVGIVHGMAGSAAVALLVLAQIHDARWASAYLLLFGVGTTAGMMLITSVVAVPFVRSQRRPLLNLGLQAAGGTLSVAMGGYLAWQIGIVGGLIAGAS